MKNFKRFVVAVDVNATGRALSEGSIRAIRQAEWIAAHTGGTVTLVHSSSDDRIVETEKGGWGVVHEGFSADALHQLEQEVERLREMDLAAELSIRREKPFLAIVREAIEKRADLVLMGKHDELLDGARIGSVAIKVMRKCPTPVWVVKPGADPAPKVIVAATDLSPVGRRAVEYGAFVAKEFGSELHVVHAYQITMEAQMQGGAAVEALKTTIMKSVKTHLEGIEFAKPPVLHVGSDAPSHALLEADTKLKPGLFVMGTISRSGIPGLLMGNTAEKVLHRLRGSLLVVKPEDFVSPL